MKKTLRQAISFYRLTFFHAGGLAKRWRGAEVVLGKTERDTISQLISLLKTKLERFSESAHIFDFCDF